MKIVKILTLSILLFITACISPTPEETSFDPIIESVTLNYSQLNKTLFIAAGIYDPQGLGNIDSVKYSLYQRDSLNSTNETLFQTGQLSDEGPAMNDIIRLDGVYSCLIDSSALAGNDGYYRVTIQVIDKDGNTSDIEEQEELVAPNSPPVLYPLELPSTFEKGDILIFKIRVTDPQGPDDIVSMTYSVLRPDDSFLSDPTFYLSDEGPASGYGDEVANDGIYTVYQPSSSDSPRQGNYTFYFVAEDKSGAASDTLKKVITNPGIHLLSPDWATTINVGDTCNITWESAYISKVTIQYTTNANATSPTYNTINSEVSASLGSYKWVVPYMDYSTNCKIKIFDKSKPARYDISDNSFTIKP